MSERNKQLLHFYREHRVENQTRFYAERRSLFDRAAGQALAVSAMLLGLASAASALSGTDIGAIWIWTALATILPATATALAAYSSLYAFEQQSKVYGDAIRAVHAASRWDPPSEASGEGITDDVAELVKRVEAVFRQEQAQWGQLTSQIAIADDTKA
jgi:hypothetical protein